MGEWKEYKLKDLTTKIGSGATPTGGGNNYKLEGISLIRSQNILDLKFSYNGLALIDDEQADGLRNVIVNEDDVLLNITGDSVARVCKVPKKALPARVNQHVAIIRADHNRIHPDFLLYYLQAIKEFLLGISEIGGTRNALTKAMIENLDVIIPEPDEQKSIASILSSLDDKIDLLHRQNKTLEQLAETLFRQWFVNHSTRLGRLGSLIESTFGGEWGKEIPEGEYNFPVNCIRGTDIADLQIGLANRTPVRFVKEKKYKSIEMQIGDLVMEISGGSDDQSTGRTILINDEVKNLFNYPLVFSNFCRLIRPTNSEFARYLLCYINLLYDQGDFFNLENGSSGIRNFDYKAFLYELEYEIHDQSQIIKFDKSVKHFFEKINKNKFQIRTLTKLRDTLLPKLMSGEVRVKN